MDRQKLQEQLQKYVDEGLECLHIDGIHNWLNLYQGNLARFVDGKIKSNNNGNLISVSANTSVEQFCESVPEEIIQEVMLIIEQDEKGLTKDYSDY